MSDDEIRIANHRIAKWLSAALSDPNVCEAMKDDINNWFEAHEPWPDTPADAPTIDRLTAERDAMARALEFYADPFAWKKKYDPENYVQVPDFYSETSFGDTAERALASSRPAKERS